MTADNICTENGVRGHVSLWRVDEHTGLKVPVTSQHNQVQYTWGYLAAKALGLRPQSDRPKYHISAIYFEYANVSTPETAVSEAQSFSKELSISFYNSFAGDRDYLRVPIILEPAFSTSAGYADKLPIDQETNQLTFFAQTSGNSGVRGIGFGSNVNGKNSKIYAAALVATPDINDPTKDVIFARTVFSESNQVPKEASSQIGITWNIAFT
jgi:hypothetical protein